MISGEIESSTRREALKTLPRSYRRQLESRGMLEFYIGKYAVARQQNQESKEEAYKHAVWFCGIPADKGK